MLRIIATATRYYIHEESGDRPPRHHDEPSSRRAAFPNGYRYFKLPALSTGLDAIVPDEDVLMSQG
jgi:hypothetical protein